MDKRSQDLLNFLETKTKDPIEQLLLALDMAQQQFGYVPADMHVMASMAIIGLGGRNPNSWKLLAGLVGTAIAEGMVNREEVIGVLDKPADFLETFRQSEQRDFTNAKVKAKQSTPGMADLRSMKVSGKLH